MVIILYIKIDDVTSICSENFWTEEGGEVVVGGKVIWFRPSLLYINSRNERPAETSFFNIIQKYIIMKNKN